MQEKNCYHTNNVTLCKDNILHTVDSLRLIGGQIFVDCLRFTVFGCNVTSCILLYLQNMALKP